MQKNVKGPLKGTIKNRELDDEIVEDEIETEKFINRLAIQRKLLNNFVELTTSQKPKQVEVTKKSIRFKSIKFNKD